MDGYLRKRVGFINGYEPKPDENGISYYFLLLDTPEKVENVLQKAKEFEVESPGLFRATHYKDIDHASLIKRGHLDSKYASYRLKKKPRVVGIHVSHTAALRHFIDSGKGKWAMIFEEDMVFPSGASDAKQKTIDYIKEAESALDYDKPQVHYMGHCYAGQGGERIGQTNIIKAHKDKARPRCRHSYLVNKTGAKELLKKSYPMNGNGDEMWANIDFMYFHDDGNIIVQDWMKHMTNNAIRTPTAIKDKSNTSSKPTIALTTKAPNWIYIGIAIAVFIIGAGIYASGNRKVGLLILACFVVALPVGIVTGLFSEEVPMADVQIRPVEGNFNDQVKKRMASFPTEYLKLVDKQEAKAVADEGGYSGVPDVDIEKEDSFVLKPNNSTGVVIVVDNGVVTQGAKDLVKKGDSVETVRQKLGEIDEKWRKRRMWEREDFYNQIPYKMVKEKKLENTDDYKFHTTDGKIHLVQIHYDREDPAKHRVVFVDENYKLSKNSIRPSRSLKFGKLKPKPKNWDKMVEMAKNLSKGMDYVRVDLYEEGPYLGEFTFTPNAGGSVVEPEEFNDYMTKHWSKGTQT